METACGYLSEDHVLWVSSDDPKWKGRLQKLAKEHPDEVKIICKPEDNDGCIYLKCPSNWLKISPPKKMNVSITDEQRAEMGKRMEKARQAREKKKLLRDAAPDKEA